VLRVFALAGNNIYGAFWAEVWQPWQAMLANNLSTWEEDNVRQRSDCHTWGSVPVYKYCTELAGIHPTTSGSTKVLFKPQVRLSEATDAKIALGRDNLAIISWNTAATGEKHIEL
jgi:hypothetical protein